MSQHAQSTNIGPPRAWIPAGVVATVLSAVATGYMIAGPQVGGRDAVGFLLGVTLTGFLAGHTVGLIVERAVAYDRELRLRAERWAARQPEPVVNEAVDRHLDESAGWAYGGQPVDDSPPLAPPTYPEPEKLGYQADPGRPWLAAEPDEELEDREPSPQEIERWARYGGGQAEPVDPVEQATAVLNRVVADYRDSAHEPPYDRHTVPTWNAFRTAQERQAARSQIAVPLPPREPAERPYVDPGPFSTFVGVPVSPGRCDRELGEADTVVLARVTDEDATETIERVQA